jgi:hypothetical protein
MDLVTELRLLFALGVLGLAAVASGVAVLLQRLQDRLRRRGDTAGADGGSRGAEEAPGRLGRELTVRQARWRALL